MSINLISSFKANYRGVLVCFITAVVANLLAVRYQAPVMIFAVLLGLVLNFLHQSDKFQPGIQFCSTSLLRAAVALLGVRIVFSDIISLGYIAPLIVVSAMLATLVFGILLARSLGLPTVYGVLSGGSVAVCGVSAAAAIATVLPKKGINEKLFALTLLCITALGTLAMIFYPLLATALNLPDNLAGVFIGGAIHDVAQAVGAGYSISPEAGDTATYIKLMRVTLLFPIVLIIFIAFRNKKSHLKQGGLMFIPPFLIAFFFIIIINNFGLIAQPVIEKVNVFSNASIIVAMTAIGMKTSLSEVLSMGWKPVILLVSETLFLAAILLSSILYFL